jgi:sRNA-binding protein
VPADRAAELAAELEPVLALLTDVREQAERIRRDGRAEAARLRAQAAAQAETAVAEATARVVAVRAETAARERAASPDGERIMASARENVERMRERAAARMGDHVDRVVASELAALVEGRVVR